MAKRKHTSPEGFGKLLDAWVPAENAGDAIGCIATTFTFNAAFFEEECLASFLGLESEPNEDGPAYLIEREEKLAKLSCAAVLVDSHHCRGSRNLRWDLLPARLPGIQHAKVSLMVWTNRLRLIIGSANLTEDGYRRNLEVFGVLDYFDGSTASIDCLTETTAFLRRIVKYGAASSTGESPAVNRWNRLLEHVGTNCSNWGTASELTGRMPVRVLTIFVEPDASPERSCLSQLQKLLPKSARPYVAKVVSPFFDPPEAPNQPATEILKLVRKRDKVTIKYHVTGEDVADGSADGDTVFMHAPKSLTRPLDRESCEVKFYRVQVSENRPLHAKGIWLEDDRWVVYQIGSSNFTSAGLGIAKRSNIEANLVYIVDATRDPTVFKSFEASFPASEYIATERIEWKPVTSDEELAEQTQTSLPEFFASATYAVEKDGLAVVILEFGSSAPNHFKLTLEGEKTAWFDSVRWSQMGSPKLCRLPWDPPRPPSGFEVHIDNSAAIAWIPVNAMSAESLPPPDELKDLSLDVLIELLSSARPLHRQLAEYLRRKKQSEGSHIDGSIIDPHKRVDTSQFLLQRTRRISWALGRLRERMERPAATLEVLQWRLYGPVGVLALANAIFREARSAEESSFLLVELALELSRVNCPSVIGCISADIQVAEIQKIICDLQQRVNSQEASGPENLRQYVLSVFEEVTS